MCIYIKYLSLRRTHTCTYVSVYLNRYLYTHETQKVRLEANTHPELTTIHPQMVDFPTPACPMTATLIQGLLVSGGGCHIGVFVFVFPAIIAHQLGDLGAESHLKINQSAAEMIIVRPSIGHGA